MNDEEQLRAAPPGDRTAIALAVREIARYTERLIALANPLSQEALWRAPAGFLNAIGTLAHHLTGNLNHYFGAGILSNGYVRDRDQEFGETGLPKEVVIAELRAAVDLAERAAGAITEEQLSRRPWRTPCGEEYASLAYHIVRLATHLALHVGQAECVESILTRVREQ